MTSMFDQFEQDSSSTQKKQRRSVVDSPGYMYMEENEPIFSKSKKDFTPSDKITHVAIANKFMVVAMENGILFRMDIHQPNQQDEISISRYTSVGRLTNLFLDPTGNHLLLAFAARLPESSPELIYLNRKSTKLRATSKFRGHEFTEVAWNCDNYSEQSTGPILLGTSKGLIFETEISVLDGDKFFTTGFSSGIEQYWKQIFDIGKGQQNTPIKGLKFFKTQQQQICVFVTTPNRLYYFTSSSSSSSQNDSKPLIQQVFNNYLNVPEKETFIEVQSARFLNSKLRFWGKEKFAWLTEKQIIVHPNLSKTHYKKASDLKEDLLIIDLNSLNLKKSPFDFILTEFHCLLAYFDSVKALNLLNKELIYEDNYNEAFGKLIGLINDDNNVWGITENALFKYKIYKEDRNVWKIFAEKNQFDLAKKYSIKNEAYYNQVLIKEASMLFDLKEYEKSAECFAQTSSSFEEICLKFIEKNALKTFLIKKLGTLKSTDKTQITMICLWVIEIYLNEIEALKFKNDHNDAQQCLLLQKEFESFLIQPFVSDCIRNNKNTIYKLMASHGDQNNLIKLSIVNKDFEKLIRHHINKQDFMEALNVLKSQNNNRELFYSFTPLLIKEIPKLMIKALIEQRSNLNPIKLLPAFVSCHEENQFIEIIKYLEFCINELKNAEKAVHNLLLSLYAKHDPGKLMDYLNKQGQDLIMVNYDVYFALRLCKEKNLTEACVQLSALLGLWESAVDLALEIKVDLAKKIANMPPQNDVELRKKLWLKIAQHVINGKDDIETAMKFLKECDLIRIEDILPFFSDFVTIDHFKEPICNSLKEYNQHIQDLKDEMEEATKSAELVRKEIQSFRNRYTFVKSNDVCDICELVLMIRPFYMFPCKHRFHTDCLLKELNPMLGQAKKNKLADLHRQLNVLNAQNGDTVSTGSSGISLKDSVKQEIDNVIASECLYCGENMIKNINLPFIEESDYEQILKEWE